jgi:neurotransmitter:Na+ symporter, NSS family
MTREIDSSVHQRFSSRLGLMLSVLGVAVGTGNIWRFPRIAAQTGGDQGAGAFLVAWVVFLFLWSIPLIIAEYALGRASRQGPVGAFTRLAGPKYSWMGAFVAFVTAAITFYYSVVVGWCIYYFWMMLTAPLPTTTEAAMAAWNGLQGSQWPVVCHAIAITLGGAVVWRGIRSIERVNTVLMPLLLLTVLVSLVRAITLPGALEGISYLFTPEWGQLTNPRVWLEALTQNAWDTGAGWGLFLTYGAYMGKEHDLARSAFFTAIGNNTISLLAGMLVFGTVFAVLGQEMGMNRPEVLAIARSSGPASTGLTLIWMPQLFARMGFGKLLACLFFFGLTVAGFTSLVAQIELQVRVLIDIGWRRPNAILLILIVAFVCGLPSARSVDFLGNQDFVWGVALMLSGGLVAFAVVRYGAARLRLREILASGKDLQLGAWWDLTMKYFVPCAAVVLLVWWLSLSATVYAPDDWYDPFNPSSVMTCLVQWGLAAVVFLSLNRWLAGTARSSGAPDES